MSDVVVVGAGIAGLTCAVELASRGISFLLLEASDGVGGRVRTDRVDGFLLDRGFQVLLTAYPEAERLLDYEALHLGTFEPGALVRVDGKFHAVGDPIRRPATAFETMIAPIGTLADKMRIAALRRKVTGGELEDIFLRPETSTMQRLRKDGFSEQMIDRFFRPFLGGIFLERDLETSSRMFEFVFRMFSLGDAALPAGGMGAIAEQIASKLPADAIRLNQRVTKIEDGKVWLESGEEIPSRAVVIATERHVASSLVSRIVPEIPETGSRSTVCFYYAAEEPPIRENLLVLNGGGRGPINNLSVPSGIAPSYAPAGEALISATVLGPAADERAVRNQLKEWFGKEAESWRLLRTYAIKHALPVQDAAAGGVSHTPAKLKHSLYVCGDHRDTASINGAMLSGRRAAEAVAGGL